MSTLLICIFSVSLLFTGTVNAGVYNVPNDSQNNIASFLFPDDLKPDADLTVPQLIQKYGFPFEEHKVITKDNYILTLHRIPHGRDGAGEPKKRKVVFLQHGFIASSADWIENSVEKSLAYELADRKYDVWLGNARGNTYSREHVNISPSDKAFWNFSFHEMGLYDIPAVIDYILEETKQEKLFYIGHSMGTTMFWISMSLNPFYNSKIQLMIALAPVAYVQYIKSPVRLLAPFAAEAEIMEMMFGDREFLPHAGLVNIFRNYVCHLEPLEDLICENIVFLMSGFDRAQLNETMVPVILGHTPAGTSTKTLIHFAQGINFGKFRRFDYGKEKNLAIYGEEFPPNYNISGVTAPVALYCGNNDWLADEKDVSRLASVLPHLVRNYKVPYDKFTHLDFLFAIDVNKFVYNNIFELLDKYSRDD